MKMRMVKLYQVNRDEGLKQAREYSTHPKHGFLYPVNYGYITNTIAPDGEEIDAYFLGVDEPVKIAEGICIAVIHRSDDDDDSLVVIPEGLDIKDEEIGRAVKFQEQFFKFEIIR